MTSVSTIVVGIIAAVVVTAMEVKLLWEGVRSIMNKPLSIRPSEDKWAKVQISVEKEDLSEYYSTEDDGVIMRGGIPIVNHISTLKVESVNKIKYEYEGKTYTATVRSKGRLGSMAQVYCLKSDPQQVKLYIEQPPKPMGAAISYFIILAMLVLCEVALVSQLIS